MLPSASSFRCAQLKMTIKPTISILIGTLLFLVGVFFVGIYRDPEFPSEVATFIKYKPTTQFEFVDYEAGDNQHPTAEMERQTRRYYEFLEHKPADISPLLLQGILTFLVLGIVYWRGSLPMAISKVLLHFISSVIFTTIGFGYLLHYYDTGWRTPIFIVIVTINVLIAVLLTRKLHTTVVWQK
jgi:hypothetical protein